MLTISHPSFGCRADRADADAGFLALALRACCLRSASAYCPRDAAMAGGSVLLQHAFARAMGSFLKCALIYSVLPLGVGLFRFFRDWHKYC